MSETDPTPNQSSGDDDFLSGDGPATFGGFQYKGGVPGVLTHADITGRPPGSDQPTTQHTDLGSDFVGWSFVTDFQLKITKTDSEHSVGSTTYMDGGRPSSSDPAQGYYCTGVDAHIERGDGGGGNSPKLNMIVMRTWTEHPNP